MNDLLGTWRLVEADEELEINDPVEMEFRPNGELIYAVNSEEVWQIMRLRYRIHGNVLITDQPSAPREERTVFTIDKNGQLVLDYEGAKSRFVRAQKRAPEVPATN